MSEPVATTPTTLFMGELNPPTGTPTKLPALPTPSSDPDAMRVFLEKVKEILEVYEGIRGSKFDQVVTWRDMFQNGMVDLTVSGTRVALRYQQLGWCFIDWHNKQFCLRRQRRIHRLDQVLLDSVCKPDGRKGSI